MGCYYHNEREVVGKCKTCGKELCQECYDLTNGRACYACADNAKRDAKKNIIKNIVLFSITAVVLIFVVLVLGAKVIDNEIIQYVAIGVGIAGLFIPGWIYAGVPLNIAFNTKSSRNTLKYLFIRFLLAIVCGALSIVIYLISLFVGISRLSKANKDVKILNSREQSIPPQEEAVLEAEVIEK